jgi:dipeptidyl aminopeptidase/acylaminoacyl peptidase
MRKLWRGVAAAAIVAIVPATSVGPSAARAAAASTNALAFVTAGQVSVIEASNLTTAGVGQTPLWSPDGSGLVFVLDDYVANSATIYLANSHGADAKVLTAHAYPWVNPGWSRDGKYVLYTVPATKLAQVLPNASASPHPIKLKVVAMKVSNKSTTNLGTVTFTAGCSSKVTALANAFAVAEGAYLGTPNTLIWAQPNLVAIQSSCTGQGLTVLNAKTHKTTSLPTWFGGVLSPDGSTIAASVTGAKPSSPAQVGLLTVKTGKTQVLGPKLGAASLAWSPDGKNVYVATVPSNPQTGTAHIYQLSKDGKKQKTLFSLASSGIFHLSALSSTGSIAFTVVASSPAAAQAPPQALVENLNVAAAGTKTAVQPLVLGGQGGWRP